MKDIPPVLVAYHKAGKPLTCDLGTAWCEFWPLNEVATYNKEYQVPELAPGYIGFASDGGGEMYAFSPAGQIVRLPFIGMEPRYARVIAESWPAFENMLRNAL